MKKKLFYAACAVEIHSPGNVIQLLPAGEFRAMDGRPEAVKSWKVDQTIAASIIQASTRQSRLVIDYEHQTLNTGNNGQPAPAAGWFSLIEWRDGQGLFATDVEWTDKAKEMIKNGEYRYISPVFSYDDITGAITAIVSAALTNAPALDGMKEVTALKLIKPQEAQKIDLADIHGLMQSAGYMLEALKRKDGEIESLKAQMTDLNRRIQTEMQTDESRKVATLIDEAVAAGRIVPSQVTAARQLGRSNFAALKQMIDNAVPVVALTGMQTDKLSMKPMSALHTLSDEELAVCRIVGRSPDDYIKLKQQFDNDQ